MKKNLKLFVILIIVLSFIPMNALADSNEYLFDDYGMKNEVNVLSNFSRNANWDTFEEKSNVPLSKEWTVKFSGEVTKDKIDGMVIEIGDEFIPVRIKLTGNDEATVTPVESYKSNSKYTLKIFLNNGRRYKMDFTTMKNEKPDLNDDNSFGSSFIYDAYCGKFKINIGRDYSFDIVQNRYSENNGDTVVKIPVTVENIGSETGYIAFPHVDIYNSLGNSTSSAIRSYFDDGDDIYKKMRPGAKASGSIYILYSGPGNYHLEFDYTTPKVEIKLPIN